MASRAKEYQKERRDHPLGDGCYLDTQSRTYIWRGRVAGKSARRAIRHPQTNMIATIATMSKTEAKRIAKGMTVDARRGEGVFAPEPDSPASSEGITVQHAWAMYWMREASMLASSRQKKAHWEKVIQPQWGHRPLSSITDDDCCELINAAVALAESRNESGTAANNLFKTLQTFFNWCRGRGRPSTRLKVSPMDGMERPIDVTRTKRPARALDEQELIWLFRALAEYAAAPGLRADANNARAAQATECLLRSMCRRSDIFAARWPWLQEDGLLIPKTKNSYAFLLPLPPSMRALIGDASGFGPIWGSGMDRVAHTIEAVRRTMTGIAAKEGFSGDFSEEYLNKAKRDRNPYHFTLHDFRDTAKGWLARQLRTDDDMPRYPLEVQEACLEHREKGVGAIYNANLSDPRWAYAQRKRAGEAWNAYLDTVKSKALAPNEIAA